MQRAPLNSTDASDAADESSRSGVSWAAIIAGAVASAALGVILLAFGSGVGFASLSPWPGAGASAKGVTIMAAVWLIIVQWVSSGLGGYLTGRLRCKWVGVHDHEVFFRDTAHGFLSWALATVIGVGVLAAGMSHMAAGAGHRMGRMEHPMMMSSDAEQDMDHQAGFAMRGHANDPMAYYVDSLFRTDHPDTNANDQDARAESERILITGFKNDGVSDQDKAYLTQLVAAKTGLSQGDADKRVNDVLAKEKDDEARMRQLADDARKAASAAAVYVFLSLLIGAFIASVAAALGGHDRDKGWGTPSYNP